MKYKNWAQQEDQQLESLLLSKNYSFTQIGEFLRRTQSSCQCRARRLNLDSYFVNKKYHVDERFWDELNNINCYWAGFSAADANVYYKGKTGIFRIELSHIDKEHLKKFKQSCQFSGEIKDLHRAFHNPTCKISINSQIWLSSLEKNFGIVPNKTKRMIPSQLGKEEFNYCWLIGYIDGDGSIYYAPINNNIRIQIVSSNIYLLEFSNQILQHILLKIGQDTDIPSIKKINNKNCYLLTLSGKRAAHVINFLKNVECPKLTRKWEQENVNLYVQKVINQL